MRNAVLYCLLIYSLDRTFWKNGIIDDKLSNDEEIFVKEYGLQQTRVKWRVFVTCSDM